MILVENKKREIAKFYEQIFLDAKLKERLEEKLKKIANEEDFRKLIREEIMPLMKKFKVNFSEEELLTYEEETLKKLSKEALANVSGGASIKSALLTGGLLSMALLGGVGLNSSIADASGGQPKPTQQGRQQRRKSARHFKPTIKKEEKHTQSDDDDEPDISTVDELLGSDIENLTTSEVASVLKKNPVKNFKNDKETAKELYKKLDEFGNAKVYNKKGTKYTRIIIEYMRELSSLINSDDDIIQEKIKKSKPASSGERATKVKFVLNDDDQVDDDDDVPQISVEKFLALKDTDLTRQIIYDFIDANPASELVNTPKTAEKVYRKIYQWEINNGIDKKTFLYNIELMRSRVTRTTKVHQDDNNNNEPENSAVDSLLNSKVKNLTVDQVFDFAKENPVKDLQISQEKTRQLFLRFSEVEVKNFGDKNWNGTKNYRICNYIVDLMHLIDSYDYGDNEPKINNDNYEKYSVDDFLAHDDNDLDASYVYEVAKHNPAKALQRIDGEKLLSFWTKLYKFTINIPERTGNRATYPALSGKDNLEVQNNLKIIEYFQKELLPLIPPEIATIVQNIEEKKRLKEEIPEIYKRIVQKNSELYDLISMFDSDDELGPQLKTMLLKDDEIDRQIFRFIRALDINFDSNMMRFMFENERGEMQETTKKLFFGILKCIREFYSGYNLISNPNSYSDAIKLLLLFPEMESVDKMEYIKERTSNQLQDFDKAIEKLKEFRKTNNWNTVPEDIKEKINKSIEVFGDKEMVTAEKPFKADGNEHISEKFNSFKYKACPKGMTAKFGPHAQKLIDFLKELLRLKGIFEFSDSALEENRDKIEELLNQLDETTRENIVTDCKYFNGYIDKSGKKLNGWITDYPMDNLNIIKFICDLVENAE